MREEELLSPEELMPLYQTLISPDLAIAFDIRDTSQRQQQQQQQQQQFPHPPPPSSGNPTQPSSDSAGEEPARTLKRPRLVWTPQLHKRFVDAVAHLGIKNAVPKTIMQLMSVDGLTRENVASHLQKYRLYLKRMQGLSGAAFADPATDHLFATSPVPPHFLHPSSRPFLPVPAIHHHRQMPVAAATHPQYHRQVPNGHFELPFLSHNVLRTGTPVPGYAEDLESANAYGGRNVLTLFPTGDD